jgi:exosome complex RNA-binding protein Rrp42 (RNase PH superfamily)
MFTGKDAVRAPPRASLPKLTTEDDRVLAFVEGKMVRPMADRPFEGMVTIHSEISPMASNEYETGR